jgi:hypothetical protein
MKAAFGVRFLPDDFLREALRPPFLAELFLAVDFRDDLRAEDFLDEDFFLELFFFAAILSPG